MIKFLFLFNCLFFVAVSVQADEATRLKENFQNTRLFRLPVSQTNAGIKFHPEEFHLYGGCGAGNDCAPLLFVMLPGTHGSVGHLRLLLRAMVASGLAVIGLEYQDGGSGYRPLHSAVDCLADEVCFDQFRRDRVMGAEKSRFVAGPQEGIIKRLLKALQFLKWNNFYEGDQLRFEKIIFAGHSQGAGMAAWIGKHYLVKRVVQYAGTSDAALRYRPRRWMAVPWTKAAGKTPPQDYFAFYHRDDPFYERDRVVWDALGMEGDPVAWTENRLAQKIFTTDACLGDRCPHYVVVGDGTTPRLPDGTPAYLETWVRLGNPLW